jgi:hypothetical protein
MEPKTWVFIGIVVVAVLLILWAVVRQRRSAALRQRFGPEYDRTVREHGAGQAETVLAHREERVKKFPIRALSPDEREHFVTEWRVLQTQFVDDPEAAVSRADLLVGRLMQARGYPVTEFEQRAADLSVDHPRVVDNYRAAHEIALRQQRGMATTEDLRNALIYYRTLFDELLQTKPITGERKVA